MNCFFLDLAIGMGLCDLWEGLLRSIPMDLIGFLKDVVWALDALLMISYTIFLMPKNIYFSILMLSMHQLTTEVFLKQ